jgi:hypothetical protein
VENLPLATTHLAAGIEVKDPERHFGHDGLTRLRTQTPPRDPGARLAALRRVE